tara:strand:- start:27314 stop:28102 length:789 start_codon:yes stop_codon:yes gene_type:complete
MSQLVLFQMWSRFRQSLIESHLFYFEQANKRLLSQFDDIESEADKASAAWLEENAQYFNQDVHDLGEFEEQAYDAGVEFYQLLSDMRDTTRLSVVAGMYQEWDKSLRQWLVDEIHHWHNGNTVLSMVWKKDIARLIDLMESFDWKIRAKEYFPIIDACRLVINVHKHGDGNSLIDLKARHPEYLVDPLKNIIGNNSAFDFIDHTHLSVSVSQLEDFSDAIVAFWKDVPENIFNPTEITLPEWFEKAMQTDHKASQNQGGLQS